MGSVELGANWIHGANNNNPMSRLASHAHLRTVLVPGSTANLSNYVVYDDQGEVIPAAVLAPTIDNFNAASDCANETAVHAPWDMSVKTALAQ